MSTNARVQLRRTRGWRMPLDAARADRSTEWGNPFRVGVMTEISPEPGRRRWLVESGDGAGVWLVDSKEAARAKAVELYRAWLALPRQRQMRDRIRLAFRHRRPACWCGDGPCHADVIAEVAATPLECEAA